MCIWSGDSGEVGGGGGDPWWRQLCQHLGEERICQGASLLKTKNLALVNKNLFVCLPGGQLHTGEQCGTPWGRWTIGARVRKLKNQTLNNYLVICWETVFKHIISIDVHYRWCCCMITLLKHIQKSNSNKYPVVEGNHILQPLFDLYVVVWEHISFQPGMQEQEQTLLRHSPTTREMWGCLKAATSHVNRSTRWVFSLKAAFN